MSTVLTLWVISFVALALLLVGAALIDAFNDLSRQIKEFLNDHE